MLAADLRCVPVDALVLPAPAFMNAALGVGVSDTPLPGPGGLVFSAIYVVLAKGVYQPCRCLLVGQPMTSLTCEYMHSPAICPLWICSAWSRSPDTPPCVFVGEI